MMQAQTIGHLCVYMVMKSGVFLCMARPHSIWREGVWDMATMCLVAQEFITYVIQSRYYETICVK